MIKFFFFHLITLLLFFHIQAQQLPRAGFFAEASALYWKAQENGLSYAIKSSSSDRLAPDASIKNPDFDWDFGFKCGIGYRVPHDLWQLKIYYTSLQTHTDANKKANDGDGFFPIWTTPTQLVQFVDEVKMHWRLHLGLLDALLSRSFTATPTLLLTPQIGIRNGWIRQKFNLEYLGGNLAQGGNELIRMKNKYWGIGPKAGLFSEWEIARGFNLFAEGSATLLFGEFYLHQDEDALGTKEKLLGVHNIFRASAPILEGTAGLRWQHLFSGALKRLQLELAWDQLLFFSQNQLMRFLDASTAGQFALNQGDLSIAGCQFGARLDF